MVYYVGYRMLTLHQYIAVASRLFQALWTHSSDQAAAAAAAAGVGLAPSVLQPEEIGGAVAAAVGVVCSARLTLQEAHIAALTDECGVMYNAERMGWRSDGSHGRKLSRPD